MHEAIRGGQTLTIGTPRNNVRLHEMLLQQKFADKVTLHYALEPEAVSLIWWINNDP